jgi:hypothetical protein
MAEGPAADGFAARSQAQFERWEIAMRRLMLAMVMSAALAAVPAAALAARNPSGTGPPSQSCQELEAEGARTPGHAAQSPGSPFNEPEINSENGGTGGQHYSETSQYDVACFQHS